MNISLYIAKRYLISKSSQNAVNIINFVTFLVIVIGAASLFVVLSAFAGLKTLSLSFSNSFDPDLKAISSEGKFFDFTENDKIRLDEIEGIADYSKEIEERIFLTFKQKNHIAYIKAVDSNYTKVTAVDSLIYYGGWMDEDPYQVVTGLGIANILGLGINDYRNPLKILAPKPGEGSITSGISGTKKPYNELSVTLSGVYAVNDELDKKYVFARLSTVQPLLEKHENQITGINFKLTPNANPDLVIPKITEALDGKVTVKTRAQLNDSLYKMLNTENLAIYLIFTLVLIIALFNVVGAIIMMILDKKENATTLYSMGVSIKQLKRIFFLQGLLVTAVGGLIGIVVASLLVWSQIAFQWLKLTPSLAYPVEYQWGNVAVVFVTIFVLGFIASKIAANRVNKQLIQFN
ncbi:ABC transporter permease [Galbibacter mesophilus]|uniref:ABC transporter permease n=1 Tax=Galbibacter mesophilus TaxID=379069 RepID=UPI00191EBB83|nr:FtsX-like permease family protein [Galbibacter mesophilus]MCM5662290.1 FtsX-like permease family protein [Galbibacter mesophilus]